MYAKTLYYSTKLWNMYFKVLQMNIKYMYSMPDCFKGWGFAPHLRERELSEISPRLVLGWNNLTISVIYSLLLPGIFALSAIFYKPECVSLLLGRKNRLSLLRYLCSSLSAFVSKSTVIFALGCHDPGTENKIWCKGCIWKHLSAVLVLYLKQQIYYFKRDRNPWTSSNLAIPDFRVIPLK